MPNPHTFTGDPIVLYVPKGSKDAYCRSPWGRFTYIVEFEK